MQISGYTTEAIAERHKALADPTRVRIVHLLLQLGELCGCDVETGLDITQSKASRHLATLKRAGLVADRREGTWVYYRIVDPEQADPLTECLLDGLRASLIGEGSCAQDLQRSRACRRSPCPPADEGPVA